MKKSALLLLLLFNTLTALAQLEPVTVTAENIITKHYFSVKDGLAAREVFCAVEDKDGFIWFGTSNGLCRYDGNAFKTFTKQNFGLLHNEIASLSIDANNHLIIEFNDRSLYFKRKGEIQVLDLNNSTLKTLKSIYPKVPFQTKDVVWIANDGTKNMLFVTASPFQVWKYTTTKGFKLLGKLSAWKANKKIDESVNPAIPISAVIQNGSVILKKQGYPSYLISADRLMPFSNKREESVYAITKSKSFLFHNNISNTISKRNFPNAKNAFVTSNTESFLHLSPNVNYPWMFPAPHSDAANIVYNIKKGIYLFDGKTTLLLAIPEELKKYIDFNVSSTFKDSRGNRWICSNTGVLQISIEPNYFARYFSRQQITKPTYNQVRGIYVDNRFDLQANKARATLYANVWEYLCISEGNSKKTAFSSTKKLAHFNAFLKHRGKFYIGGVDKICEYKPSSNKTIEIGAIGDKLDGNYIWSLTTVSDSILLAGHIKGLSKFNLLSKKSSRLRYVSSKIPKAENVYRFVKTKTKGLVAVAENGLYFIDKNNTVVDYYGSLVSEKSHHLPLSDIYDMYEDKNGICWIASNGEGLFRWDWKHSVIDKTIKIKQFTTNDGLPSMVLYRIEEDSDNNLWIGSNNGLLRFNTIDFSTYTYTTDDGLTHNEFNRTSSFKAANGKLYFGGLNGVNAFDPEKLMEVETKKEAVLQMISLHQFSLKENKLVDVLTAFKQTKKVILAPWDSFLTLEFQLLDFKDRKHLYAYKIEGIDAEWNYIDENSIRLSGLPYGEFKMHLKAQLANGQWSNNPIIFPIIVLKPFYFQLWFPLALVLLIVGGIVLYYRFRTHQLQRENQRLEIKVNGRTEELKKSLEERELLLTEIHHRVKNNLQVIIGLLELQKEQLTDENAKKSFTEAQSRVGTIGLIHQNLYQNEHLGSIEFCSFARDLSRKVTELFENQNNPFTFILEKKEVYIDIDTAVPLGLILNELLTNSYKHFSKGSKEKKISINLNMLNRGHYELVYKDNGPGIKKAVDFDTSTSLGLKLIRGLAKQLYGTASYRFENGSVFTILFKDLEARND